VCQPRIDIFAVVLPFANRTGDPQQEYLADGITESQTMDLSSLRDAFIVDAVGHFHICMVLTAQQIGGLRRSFCIARNVQRTEDRIRINPFGRCNIKPIAWSETFDGYQSDFWCSRSGHV
jgi:TolB-like protein